MTECGRSRRIGSMRSADLIREARLRAGLTQYELAERSGRDRSVIARWEQGGVAPSVETLVELVRRVSDFLCVRAVGLRSGF